MLGFVPQPNLRITSRAASILRKIAPDNPTAIAALVELIRDSQSESTRREAASILGKILTESDKMTAVVIALKNYLSDEAYKVIWQIVQQILRWDMALLEQSPWYQEIFSKGEERGRKEELYSGIELALEIKFGNQASELMPIISQITDLQKLKTIQQAIKSVNTVNELQQVLSTNFT